MGYGCLAGGPEALDVKRHPSPMAASLNGFITGFSSPLGSCDLPPNEKADIGDNCRTARAAARLVGAWAIANDCSINRFG